MALYPFRFRGQMNDIITELFARYVNWVQCLTPRTVAFYVKATYLFGLPLILCTLTYDGENTRFARQWLMFLVGALLAFMLPAAVPVSPMLRTWVFSLASFALVAMPAILPVVLVETPPFQNRLRLLFYTTLGFLFLANQGGMLR